MGVFLNENRAQGIRGSSFQAGISDTDTLVAPEIGANIPWVMAPELTYLRYHCWIECDLDSGIVVHRQLPQSNQQTDTLARGELDSTSLIKSKEGINLKSKGKFTDTVQRMANSHYRFCLKGFALRAGYQVPIPKLVKVAGVDAIPDDQEPQHAFNRIVANNSGVPVYYAEWRLWYTVAVPPKDDQNPPDNLMDQISASTPLPVNGIEPPISYPDHDAVRQSVRRSNTP